MPANRAENQNKLIQDVCKLHYEPKPIAVIDFINLSLYDLRECDDGGGLARRLYLSFFLGLSVTVIMLRSYMFQAGTQSMLRGARDWREKVIEQQKMIIAEEVALQLAFEKIKEDAERTVAGHFSSS